jgi:hypothetical protein
MAKRWLIATALLLVLSGCGEDEKAEPATVPVPATTTTEPVAAGRTATAQAAPATSAAPAAPRTTAARKASGKSGGVSGFVAVVQDELPEVAVDHREEELAGLAQQACSALAAGKDAGAVVAGTERFGTGEADAHRLIKLAITTVCPDQDRRLGEF